MMVDALTKLSFMTWRDRFDVGFHGLLLSLRVMGWESPRNADTKKARSKGNEPVDSREPYTLPRIYLAGLSKGGSMEKYDIP